MKCFITGGALAVLSMVAACNDSPPPAGQPAHLDKLAYEAPVDWTNTDEQLPRGPTTQWVPEDNARHESLIVRRSKLQSGRIAPSMSELQALLVDAQHELPQLELGKIDLIETPLGMHGYRVESDFVPVGSKVRYHRVHAVLRAPGGDGFVHVLYTAQQPDAAHRAFDLIVNSLHGDA